jgi:WD40 repeat protein
MSVCQRRQAIDNLSAKRFKTGCGSFADGVTSSASGRHCCFSRPQINPTQPPAQMAERWLEANLQKRALFRWVNKPRHRSACLTTLTGHRAPVTACVVSPDGRRIASDLGQTLRVWDVEAEVEVLKLAGHANRCSACSFSPDGSRLVTGAADNTLVVCMHRQRRETCYTARTHRLGSSCAFSAEGNRIISGSVDTTLRMWDAADGTELLTIRGHKWGVTACAFSPDGAHILSSG